MFQVSTNFAKYFRSSLADAELGKGAVKKTELKDLNPISQKELTDGEISLLEANKLFEKAGKDTALIPVVIRPFCYELPISHGKKQSSTPEILLPLVMHAFVDRQGCLFASGKVRISRDLLEPLDNGTFTIGEVAKQDEYLTKTPTPCHIEGDKPDSKWPEFLKYAENLLQVVTQGWKPALDGYHLHVHGYWVRADISAGSSLHIIPLYEKIAEYTATLPLFENYCAPTVHADESCVSSLDFFGRRLAHSGNRFPLAPAQRDAISHILAAVDGEILATNGPPGTGKTTMLLSVVASLWAEAALKQQTPPIIVAASTNNQAVTNVIDAFGKDFDVGEGPFKGRWLPNIISFGGYLPASSKKEQSKRYQTDDFYNQVETVEYFEKAKVTFLEEARMAFPGHKITTITDAVNALHGALQVQVQQLDMLEKSWSNLKSSRAIVQDVLGASPYEKLESLKGIMDEARRHKALQSQRLKKIEDYLADESLFLGLLSFFPTVQRKRLRLLKKALNDVPVEFDSMRSPEAFEKHQKALVVSAEAGVQKAISVFNINSGYLERQEQAEVAWQRAQAPLSIDGKARFPGLAEADVMADTTIRFHAFLLTTHYWEGRWLQEMEKLGPSITNQKKNLPHSKARWSRRMMLTPCIVSTFYMLPAHLRYWKPGDSGAIPEYLFNFADWLIVDEAGQVLPEVAGASFALAKRALVIGDTLQVEPIWSIPSPVDVGNMIECNLISKASSDTEYLLMDELGKTAAAGSVMKIAQNTSRYHYDKDLPRGLFLYEHRRCFDEIIGYCNTLCYQGKLQPKRGQRTSATPFPAMGYLHVNGVCTTGHTGKSRRNDLEAETVA